MPTRWFFINELTFIRIPALTLGIFPMHLILEIKDKGDWVPATSMHA